MDYKTSPDHENARRMIASLEKLGVDLCITDNSPAIAATFVDVTPSQAKVSYGVAMGDDSADIIIAVCDVPGFEGVPFDEGIRFINEFNGIKSGAFVCTGTLFIEDDHAELRYYIDKNDHALQANLGECMKRIRAYVYEIEKVVRGEEPFENLALKGEAPFPADGIADSASGDSIASNAKVPKKKGLLRKLFS